MREEYPKSIDLGVKNRLNPTLRRYLKPLTAIQLSLINLFRIPYQEARGHGGSQVAE